MNRGTVIAPGAPVDLTWGRRAFGAVGDLALAVVLVLAVPATVAVVAGLVRLALDTLQ